jgi:hypothetical protein
MRSSSLEMNKKYVFVQWLFTYLADWVNLSDSRVENVAKTSDGFKNSTIAGVSILSCQRVTLRLKEKMKYNLKVNPERLMSTLRSQAMCVYFEGFLNLQLSASHLKMRGVHIQIERYIVCMMISVFMSIITVRIARMFCYELNIIFKIHNKIIYCVKLNSSFSRLPFSVDLNNVNHMQLFIFRWKTSIN